MSKRGFQPGHNPAVFLFWPRALLCKCALLWATLLLWAGDQHIFSGGMKRDISECTEEHRAHLPLTHELNYFSRQLYRAPVPRQKEQGMEILSI